MDWHLLLRTTIGLVDVAILVFILIGGAWALRHRQDRADGRASDFDAAHHGPRRARRR